MDYITKIDRIVKERLFYDKTGHDYGHAKRVLKNALVITNENPSEKTDFDVLKISCLLHDIAFQNKMTFQEIEEHNILGAKQAEEILKEINFPEYKIQKVPKAILYHIRSINNNQINLNEDFYEAQILSDADNLDALGGIGLIRMINFCQSQGFPVFKSKEDKIDDSIYGGVKFLLSYPKKMLTHKGKIMAEQRIKILEDFLHNIEEEIR